jgi:hypothetical protein
MLISWIALMGSLAVPLLAQREDVPTLKLPTFTVVAELFNLTYRLDSDGRVEQATITHVTKNNAVYKFGLREGAQLISVNGTRVVGLNGARFQELMREPLAWETKTLIFTQGKLMKRTITIHATGKPSKPRGTDESRHDGSGEKGLTPEASLFMPLLGISFDAAAELAETVRTVIPNEVRNLDMRR